MSFFSSIWFYNIVLTLIVVMLAWVASVMIRRFINSVIKRKFEQDEIKPTSLIFIKNSITFVVFAFAFLFLMFTIDPLRGFGKAIFASAGILAAIIGFASQKAMSNIFGGIFILLFRPFHVGDLIKLSSSLQGTVEELTLRHTVIRDFENRRIIIPNSQISEETILNSSIKDMRIRQHILFGISYDSDIDRAFEIIKEEAENHPNCLDGRKPEEIEAGEPIVMVKLVNLGDYSVDIRAWVWSEDPSLAFELKCDLLKSVKARFDSEGIEIPFPYRTIVYKDNKNSN